MQTLTLFLTVQVSRPACRTLWSRYSELIQGELIESCRNSHSGQILVFRKPSKNSTVRSPTVSFSGFYLWRMHPLALILCICNSLSCTFAVLSGTRFFAVGSVAGSVVNTIASAVGGGNAKQRPEDIEGQNLPVLCSNQRSIVLFGSARLCGLSLRLAASGNGALHSRCRHCSLTTLQSPRRTSETAKSKRTFTIRSHGIASKLRRRPSSILQ